MRLSASLRLATPSAKGTRQSGMRIIRHKIAPAILLLVVIGVLLPVSPQFITIPSRDQGVFLYAGQQILSGEILYRDV